MESECTFYRLKSFENSEFLKVEVIYSLKVPIQSKSRNSSFTQMVTYQNCYSILEFCWTRSLEHKRVVVGIVYKALFCPSVLVNRVHSVQELSQFLSPPAFSFAKKSSWTAAVLAFFYHTLLITSPY